jgi:glycine betaine transporter
MHRLLRGIDPVVFYGSSAAAIAFVLWGVLGTDSLGSVMQSVLDWVIRNFGWAFVLIAILALLFCIVLAISPYGRIRLGPDDSRPEFRTVSWIAMMFAAGLGLGLLFYGVAEPISHFAAPPHGLAEPRSQEAAQLALETTYFHWGFNGWAIYAVMGLALGYFSFRKGGKNLVSATFAPLLGENVSERPIGRTIDGLAIFATLFGTATSLGLGALQINSGLNFLWDVSTTNAIAVVIIVVITALFVLSAVSGVERGIQFLSNMSGGATVALMVFFLVVGPTVVIISTAIETIGGYMIRLFPMSFRTGVFTDSDWMAAWTIFYWAWWISWAPFVGTFVARISRGRTIREFILGVVAAPTGMGFVWFAIVGTTGIDLQISGQADLIATTSTPELSLFAALEQLPFTTVVSIVALILIAFFFISGADAASIVMAMLASRGLLEPARFVTATMGCLMGAIASALLLVGGLTALQQGAILASVPFTFVIVGIGWSMVKVLRQERVPAREPVEIPVAAAPRPAVGPGTFADDTLDGGSAP